MPRELKVLLQQRVDDDEMTKTQAEAYERGFMGSRHRLIVFETGGYLGIPLELPEDVIFESPSFHFVDRLVVLAARDLESQE